MSVDQIKEWSKLSAAERYKAMHDRVEALGKIEAENPNGMKLRTFEEKMRLYPEDFCIENPYKQRDGWATHALEYGPSRWAKLFQTQRYCVFCGHTEGVPC